MEIPEEEGGSEIRGTSEEINFVQLGKCICARWSWEFGFVSLFFTVELDAWSFAWMLTVRRLELKGEWRVSVDRQQDQILSVRNLGTENTCVLVLMLELWKQYDSRNFLHVAQPGSKRNVCVGCLSKPRGVLVYEGTVEFSDVARVADIIRGLMGMRRKVQWSVGANYNR